MAVAGAPAPWCIRALEQVHHAGESAVRRKRKPIAHRFPVGIQLTFQILYHLGESVTLGVPRLVVYFFVPPREGHRLECDGLNLVDVAYGKIDDGTDAIVVGPIHNGCH